MFLKRTFVTTVLVGLAGAALVAQAADPMVGTWKLNVAKSKVPYKSGSTIIESAGDGIKVTADLVGNDGTAYHWTWTATYDGKDAPVSGKTPWGESGVMASVTRVDAHTVKVVGKTNGKINLHQTLTVSADGKTRTVVTKGTNAKGEAIDTTSLYDKQ